jgi:pimeloyl-ACP methyl ester carboxylesterase
VRRDPPGTHAPDHYPRGRSRVSACFGPPELHDQRHRREAQPSGTRSPHLGGPARAGKTDKPAGPVLRHDAESQLARITAPTLVTFGRFDLLTSTRFAEMLTAAIKDAELHIFEDCAHTPIYQNVEALNQRTLAFVDQHAG